MNKCLFIIAIAAFPAAVSSGIVTAPPDIVENVPEEFPRFYIKGDDESAQLLNRFLYYHFANRGGNGPTVFNKEYLTLADMWMGGAQDTKRGKSIQQVHKEDLSAIEMDAEGYVNTHQHFSHSYDFGWPFPFWPHLYHTTKPQGYTVGWHFQEDVPEWMAIRGYFKALNDPRYYGASAISGWTLDNCESLGITESKWRIKSAGESAVITSPAGMEFDAFCAPFMQLRWNRTPGRTGRSLPYIEWVREEDAGFSADRRVYINNYNDHWKHISGAHHSIIEMYRHPLWNGKISRIRLSLAPGESEATFDIDSLFTVFDTRHTSNNPIMVLSFWNYFRWTGDTDFLKRNINRMRASLRYMQTEMNGLKYNRIRNTWVGHDGVSGVVRDQAGNKSYRNGHGMACNYWDILPFGGDDMYATAEYYASLDAMAEIEAAVRAHPEWDVPLGAEALDPAELRSHADSVKREANSYFWNRKNERFYGCIDLEGNAHDYGYTFLNLNAVYYGISSEDHSRSIMEWLEGRRIVESDTAKGADIYRWRFAPRASTLRNKDWYPANWDPDVFDWGYQVQDGGAVLGFTFYDLWARLKTEGPNNAWQRLAEVLDWEKEVWTAGGYREYYKDGKEGSTLQGGGTAGGLGIDHEFYESSLVPSIMVYGFMGIEPTADALGISPRLPDKAPEMGVCNLLYHGVRMDVKVSQDEIIIEAKDKPLSPIKIIVPAGYSPKETGGRNINHIIADIGKYCWRR